MKSRFHYLLFLLSALVANSCSNDLDVFDKYQENAVVYALLDPSKPLQFVKINKVFTNPGASVKDVAQIPDSLYFDSLSPMLVELENGAVRRSIPLYRANILLKDSGLFASSPNYLYVTKEAIFKQFVYQLDLRLPKTGKHISASTHMVFMQATDFFQPVNSGSSPRIFLIPFDRDVDAPVQIKFTTGPNGKIYDAYFHFNYLEVNTSDTNIKTTQTVSWKMLSRYLSADEKKTEYVSRSIKGRLFYDLLLDKIPNKPGITRRFLPCSLQLVSGSKELFDYMEALQPSIGIVQKQSDYSNIQGGLGLWASTNQLVIDQVQLAGACKQTIVTDTLYRRLQFR